MIKEDYIIKASDMLKARFDDAQRKKLNERIIEINNDIGDISHNDMRNYLLRRPTQVISKKIEDDIKRREEYDNEEIDKDQGDFDLYDEYARQFGGMLVKLMEENPKLANDQDWLFVAKSKIIFDDVMEEWLTDASAKWAEFAARYALSKPFSGPVKSTGRVFVSKQFLDNDS